MKHKRTFTASLLSGMLALAVCLGLSAGTPVPLQAQTKTGDFTFSQTGFTVPSTFMDYWRSHGGLAVFGYPISPVMNEGGYQVQYFERNR
ncbi:MAG TPA: hypothetical protein VF276_10185, partial [Chloroflexia bacterium]